MNPPNPVIRSHYRNGFYQAIRARPPDPPYRSSRQQRDRLRREQGRRTSTRLAVQALRDQ
jgi:hypothetical protein